MVKSINKIWVLIFGLVIIIEYPAAGQTGANHNKTLRAYKLEPNDKLILDGMVTEEFWDSVDIATNFLQQEPIEGDSATERTVVRVAYDQDNLYIGVMLYDSNPSGIKAFQRRRDYSLATDDRFMWILDTYNDQRSAYFFEINPLGLMGDGLLKTGQGFNLNKAWDGIWRAWVKKGSYGWSAEIRIPFRTLNFDPENDTWGINFQRTVRRKNEESLWAGHKRNQGVFRPQDAGKLVGLQDPSQGVGMEVNPYAISSYRTSDYGENRKDNLSANAGLDLNYSVTPNLRAGLTYNTDFAETEVDDRQVNLTRFPLFFPERRAFFLEGSSVFIFAPSSGVYPYFSRRIGLQDGQPVPIVAGGRLIGRINKTDIGFLQIRTKEHGENPAEDFTVGRVVQNIFEESSVGVLYTRRASSGDSLPDRHTMAADLGINTSRFLGNKNLQFQAFLATHTMSFPGDTSSFWDRASRGVRLNFPNQPWSGHVSYREFGDAFDPAVGFAPRNAFRRLQPTIAYSPLIEKSKIIREITIGYYYEHLMNLNFKPATLNNKFTVIGMRFESGDAISAELLHNYELLNNNFDILRDGRFIIQEGRYHNFGYQFELSTASFRRVAADFSYTKSGFWTGDKADYDLSLTMRPLTGVNISGDWIYSQVELAEGSFDAHIFRIVNNIDFSPWLSMNVNVQYDNLSKLIGLNNRLSWIFQPGNTVYFVYNHNWQNLQDQFHSLESRTNLKISYTYRF